MDPHISRLVSSNKIFGLAWNWSTSKSPINEPVLFQKPVSSIIPSKGQLKLVQGHSVFHESKD
jgi:hypothetical protein